MNKDEATKQWIAEYRTRMTRSMSDEEMAREMYEAGQRAERVRIADKIKEALSSEFIDNSPSAFRSRFHTIENELRADPAESGE